MYAASPDDFNDPFEWKPRVDLSSTKKQERKNIANFVKFHSGYISKNEVKRRTKRLQNLPREQRIKDFVEDITSFRKKCSVLCFSEICDSSLMWSHYSDSHRGLCVQFDATILKGSGFQVFEVKYTKNYPVFNPYREITSTDNIFIEKISLTKSHDWSYEKEHRAIFPLRKNGYVSFNPESVVRIILGCKTTKENEEKIHELVGRLCYKPLIVRAKQHEKDYKLVIPPI